MPSLFHCSVASLLLLATVASAQIAPTSPARQRADSRRAVREAGRADLPYQGSHLTVAHQLPRGGSPPNPPVANEPRFDHRGRPRKAKPGFWNWRRWAKNEPKP
ncbi:MAG: hypothetical protein ACRYG7_15885 [Janthinobacterium lividum]